MCGIIGIFNTRPAEQKEPVLNNMLAPLVHRGPDAWGTFASDEIGLGHARLSIIDISGGHQPMRTRSSVLSYNGEVYNYVELRKELEKSGREFNTTSDTEVVQQSLEVWGPDALERFNGQFALLWWDKRNKTLLAARDRFGIRPLYYINWEGGIYFASEIKAFSAINGFRQNWDPQNLYVHGLLWNTIDDSTVFSNVKTLPAGHYAVFKPDGSRKKKCYYDIGQNNPGAYGNLNQCKDYITDVLEDAVRLRLRSDVPVGCYLSGGIDSSIITLLVNKIQNESFKTFSIAFGDKNYDESEYQREMVEALNSEHCCQTIDLEHINEHFLEAAYHFERPVFRTAPLPMFLLSKRVNDNGIKVVLTGEAADEIFCGYDTFKEIRLIEKWESGAERDELIKIIKDLYPHLNHYKDGNQLGFLEMYYEGFLGKLCGPAAGLAIRIHNNQIIFNYLNKDWNINKEPDFLNSKIEAMIPHSVKDWPILRRNQYLEMKTLLSGYLLSSQGDRMAMAHSVEGRFPFLDHRLVDWAIHLPDDYKLNGMTPKFLLKDAFMDQLPKGIVNRPKQPYMAPDLIAFLPNGKPTENAAYFLNKNRIVDYGIFDPKMVSRLIAKYKRRGLQHIGYRDNMLISFILSTQMIEYWIRNPRKHNLNPTSKKVHIYE